MRDLAVAQGLLTEVPEKLGEREQTRQADLARLVRLAAEFDVEVDGFVELLHERFGESAGRGVHLLTLHRGEGARVGRRSSCRASRRASCPCGVATSPRSGACSTSD